MLGYIIVLLIIGTIAGYLARLLVPGPDKIGFLRTVALGIVGSFIGGFIGYVLSGADSDDSAFQAAGLILSVVGAIIALLIYRAMTGGPTPRRGSAPPRR